MSRGPLLLTLLFAIPACKGDKLPSQSTEDDEARTASAQRDRPPTAAGSASAPVPTPSATAPTPAVTGVPFAISATTVGNVKRRWQASIGGWGKEVALDATGKLAAATSGAEVHLFDAVTGAAKGTIQSTCSIVDGGLALVADKLVIACDHGIDLYDVATLTRAKSLAVRGAEATAASIDATHVALAHSDGVLALYPLDGGAAREIEVCGPPLAAAHLALSTDATRVAVGWPQGSIWVFAWATPNEPLKIAKYDHAPNTLALSADGRFLVEEGPSFGYAVWDLAESPAKKVYEPRSNESWTNGLAVSGDGKTVIAGTSSGYKVVIDGKTLKDLGDSHESIEALAVDARGSAFIGVDRSGGVEMFSLTP
ncbi:MAG: hypothetical protein U0271_13850 [Polyangiaceae bacterium]